MFGFCGSRSLSQQFSGLVRNVVRSVPGASAQLAVGCAPGADQFVRQAAGFRALVFRASSFSVPGAPPAAALARRSVAMVRALAAAPPSILVAFASSPCPASVFPSASASACFCGGGSGTWASLALAAGLGISVRVFVCVPAGASLSLPAWGGGSWVAGGQAGLSGVWVSCWVWVPAQLSLF